MVFREFDRWSLKPLTAGGYVHEQECDKEICHRSKKEVN